MGVRLRQCLVVGTTVAILAAAAGCGSSGGSSDSAGKVTLTFWNGFTGPDGDALKAAIGRFNKSHSKIKVQMTIMPWDVLGQKLLPALASHRGPSIAAGGVETVSQYAAKGAFAPLDDLYSGWKDSRSIFPAALNGVSYEGHKYGVPMTFSDVLMYYNKTLMKKAGLSPSQPPTNWDQLAADAVKLTKDDNGDGKPEQYGFVMADHTAPSIWDVFMKDNGGGVVSDNGKTATIGEPASVQAVQRWANMLRNKKISPAGISGPDADSLFSAGKVGLYVEGPWMTSGFDAAHVDYGVAMVPGGPNAQLDLANENVLFLSKQTASNSTEKAAAYEFFRWWDSKANQITWSTASGNPPTRSDVTAADVRANQHLGDFLPYLSKTTFFLSHVQDFSEANSIYEAAMEKITAGSGSPQNVLSAAGKQLQKLIDTGK